MEELRKGNEKTQLEVELIKKDLVVVFKLLDKCDEILEKTQQTLTDLSRIVALQDQKFGTHLNQFENLIREVQYSRHDLSDLREDISKDQSALRRDIEKEQETVKTKIGEINMWRYMIMGGMILASFLVTKFLDMAKLFR